MPFYFAFFFFQGATIGTRPDGVLLFTVDKRCVEVGNSPWLVKNHGVGAFCCVFRERVCNTHC